MKDEVIERDLETVDRLDQQSKFFHVDQRVIDDAMSEIREMVWDRFRKDDFLVSWFTQRLENISVAVWRMCDEFENVRQIAASRCADGGACESV